MKIAHVVTLVSPDGAYGGPVRVALNQLKALADLGHEVTLIGGYRGYDAPPSEIDGVPARLFPVTRVVPRTGFAGLASPRMLRFLRSEMRTFDILHLHLARDLVTLPVSALARRGRRPFFVQTHGMIDESSRFGSTTLDRFLTRPALREAARTFWLTSSERESLTVVARGQVRLKALVNGVPDYGLATSAEDRTSREVLYLARLHPRKNPRLFVEAASRLNREFPDVRFSMVGPDEGEGAAVKRLIEATGSERLRWEGPLPFEKAVLRMRQADIYVLPSINEPFPMSVLEAASLGVPSVVTDSCGLAESIARHGAGLVTDGTTEALERALRVMLSDPQTLQSMSCRAQSMARTEFSMKKIAAILVDQYERIASGEPR